MKASELWRKRTEGAEDATSEAVAKAIEALEEIKEHGYFVADESSDAEYLAEIAGAALTALKETMNADKD